MAQNTIQPTAGNVCPARDGEDQDCASSRLLVKSRMPYKPGASRPARYLAAFSAPAAKTSLDWAQCPQFDDLILSGKEHLVISGNGTAPHRGDSDFTVFAGSANHVPVIDVFRFVGERHSEGFHQHQCGAAGRIHLFTMMPLYDLHVEVLSQHGAGLTHQFQKDIDAQRKISGSEDGDTLGGVLNFRKLGLGIPGSRQYDGETALKAEGQQGRKGGGVRKIHDNVGRTRRIPKELRI